MSLFSSNEKRQLFNSLLSSSREQCGIFRIQDNLLYLTGLFSSNFLTENCAAASELELTAQAFHATYTGLIALLKEESSDDPVLLDCSSPVRRNTGNFSIIRRGFA